MASASLPRRPAPGGLVVCGMGGSGVGADLAAGILGADLRAPLVAVRGYALPPWVGPDHLVLASSYSGHTEEVLVCSRPRAGPERGVRRSPPAACSASPRLAPAQGEPAAGAPRAFSPPAPPSPTPPSGRSSAPRPAGWRRRARGRWRTRPPCSRAWPPSGGPEGPEDGEAKRLARALHGTHPIVFGAEATAAVARRWKTQLNENAKLFSAAVELPEGDHNEVCAWDPDRLDAPLGAVLLGEPGSHPRVVRRLGLTAEALGDGARALERVTAPGGNRTERVLALVLLGDLVSVYLALLDGIDPTPVAAIQRPRPLCRGC